MKTSELKFIIEAIVRETIQQLNEVQRGEWWIYPGGSAEFADGDVGDSNHEGYVISHVTREILEHFGLNVDEQVGYLGEWEENLYMILSEEGRLTDEEVEIWHNRGSKGGGGPTGIIVNKLLEDRVFSDKKQAQEAVYIAYGSNNFDARDYAMKYLGWKRMTTDRSGTNLQTWLLRPEDMEDMRRGVFDAWNDMGEEESDPNHIVSIEVRANNRMFDVPLNVFERAGVKDILTYRKETAWMRENKSSKYE